MEIENKSVMSKAAQHLLKSQAANIKRDSLKSGFSAIVIPVAFPYFRNPVFALHQVGSFIACSPVLSDKIRFYQAKFDFSKISTICGGSFIQKPDSENCQVKDALSIFLSKIRVNDIVNAEYAYLLMFIPPS